MSSPLPAEEGTVQAEPTRLKRWEFRKKKKLEKRRKRRQLNAEKIKSSIPPPPPTIEPTENEETIAEKQKYERDKALWEEREQKFKAIELVKKAAKEKEEKAKALSQKRWKDTLLNLPLMPRNFTANTNQKNTPFKTFVQGGQEQQSSKQKKTYRDRYLDQKQANIMK